MFYIILLFSGGLTILFLFLSREIRYRYDSVFEIILKYLGFISALIAIGTLFVSPFIADTYINTPPTSTTTEVAGVSDFKEYTKDKQFLFFDVGKDHYIDYDSEGTTHSIYESSETKFEYPTTGKVDKVTVTKNTYNDSWFSVERTVTTYKFE